MKYTVVIEKTGNGYSAYAPDLLGCIAAGDSVAEVEELIREAMIRTWSRFGSTATRSRTANVRRSGRGLGSREGVDD